MSATWKHDGKVVVFDPDVGTVSARSEYEAWLEVDRRKAMRREKRG